MKHSSARHLGGGVLALAGLLAMALIVPLATVDRGVDDGTERTPPPRHESPTVGDGATLASVLGLDFVRAVVTAYSSTRDQTDETPWLTAWCTRTRPGIIALSRDLLRTFTEGAPFDFGDKVLVAGVGIFRVEDTMAPRWQNRADIWFPTRVQARRWGRRKAVLARIAEADRTGDLVAEDQLHALVDAP